MKKSFIFILLALFPAQVFAHPVAGNLAGFLHPLLGFDHLLMALMVGFLAVKFGKAVLPVAFLGGMGFGSILALVGAVPAMALELALLGSVAITLLAFFAKNMGAKNMGFATCSLILAFGAMHGYAHIIEAPAVSINYVAGFFVSTAALHFVGVLMARSCRAALRRRGKDL